MGLQSLLMGQGINQTTKLVDTVGNKLDALFTSDDERLKAAQVRDTLQVEINKIEASHRTIFIAGWRPAIGWIISFALAYKFILRDLIAWVMVSVNPALVMPPDIDITELISILFVLLGVAGLRTYEKQKGLTR